MATSHVHMYVLYSTSSALDETYRARVVFLMNPIESPANRPGATPTWGVVTPLINTRIYITDRISIFVFLWVLIIKIISNLVPINRNLN